MRRHACNVGCAEGDFWVLLLIGAFNSDPHESLTDPLVLVLFLFCRSGGPSGQGK